MSPWTLKNLLQKYHDTSRQLFIINLKGSLRFQISGKFSYLFSAFPNFFSTEFSFLPTSIKQHFYLNLATSGFQLMLEHKTLSSLHIIQ